jgi:hypothetical protein
MTWMRIIIRSIFIVAGELRRRRAPTKGDDFLAS